MTKRQVICALIIIFLGSFSFSSFAGFGDSCSQLPTTNDGYLEKNTAYGYIIRSIDMKAEGGNCNPDISGITFCFKNNDKSDKPCTLYTLYIGDSKTISQLSTDGNENLGANPVLANITLTVQKSNNDICLFMPTSRGPMPVACKSLSATVTPAPTPDPTCSNVGQSCYNGTRYSQSLFNFSGLAIQCVTETLNKVFFQENSCVSDPQNTQLTTLTSFPIFQGYLKRSIGAALILYVMFFGFNMALNKEYAQTEKIALFIIKLIFVTYFSIGLGPISFESGKPVQENGMLKFGLPFLTSVAPEFAQIVFDAAGNKGLCQFDITKYPSGYKFYALWDAIDCRIGYYFGMDLLYNINIKEIFSGFTESSSNTGYNSSISISGIPNANSPDDLAKRGVFKFFVIMFGFFMAGNIIIVISGILFSVIFLSILLYFITHYLVCIITIYVMTYISPIFIPLALFTRTKAYFDGWLRVCLSCALQPMVIAGFIALLITMYDSAIFKNCEYVRHDYENSDTRFSTFELRLPTSESEICQGSLGYKLLQYYSGQGWEKRLIILFPIKSITRDVVSILAELLCILVFSIIFYYFSKSIGRFASDLTSGPNMDAVTASPTKIVDLAMKAASYAMQAAGASQGQPPSGGEGGGSARKAVEQGADLMSGGGGGDSSGSDLMSGGGGSGGGSSGVSDIVSAGGGK